MVEEREPDWEPGVIFNCLHHVNDERVMRAIEDDLAKLFKLDQEALDKIARVFIANTDCFDTDEEKEGIWETLHCPECHSEDLISIKYKARPKEELLRCARCGYEEKITEVEFK
jgi:hypothetical protein